jgi:ABC-type nitrate/sulfonate/bicarbonate transport system ATPase subunit
MSIPLFTLKNITKVFPNKEGHRGMHVLADINLTIHEGEFLLLLGPSGCGKSTLLRIITGLEKNTSGNIEFHKPFNLDEVGFVFQDFGLLPWLTVEKNVELSLIVDGTESKNRVKLILEQFGLSNFSEYYPRDLSGGMKQRVGLVRAFVTNPKLIFLDEPFSELDFFTANDLRNILLDMWKKNNTTIIMVSHYIDEAVTLADRIAVFSERPGSIIDIIPDTLSRPRDPRSPEFFALEDEVLSKFKK